ncbi:hypothetical protein ACSDQ9_07495 [Aestuariimicrobium soli]|uniref:hypothetical protein n=1 Tax=Aestuariimicrobium soli TaxID=2035834 RepID=UPI003EB70567
MSDKTISRRTVTAGVAWAVPTVVIAGAVPAFAVSKGTVTLTQLSNGCKQPGDSCDKNPWNVSKGYLLKVKLCSSVAAPVSVTIQPASVTFNGEAKTMALDVSDQSLPAGWTGTQSGSNLIVTAPAATGGVPVCADLVFSLTNATSENANIQGSAAFTWTTIAPAPPRTGSGSLILSVSATNPCNNCQPPASPPPAP